MASLPHRRETQRRQGDGTSLAAPVHRHGEMIRVDGGFRLGPRSDIDAAVGRLPLEPSIECPGLNLLDQRLDHAHGRHRAADIEDAMCAALNRAGYMHYETSAHAKPGYECRHNVNYWRFGD